MRYPNNFQDKELILQVINPDGKKTEPYAVTLPSRDKAGHTRGGHGAAGKNQRYLREFVQFLEQALVIGTPFMMKRMIPSLSSR